MDKRNLFDSDSEVSEDEPAESPQRQATQRIRAPEQELFEENFQKYVRYLKDFARETEEMEERVFGDGIWYVNHPLIETSQVNYEKNVGIFDMIDMEKNRSREVEWVKKILVSFTFVDNEIEKVIQLLEHDLYDSLVMYGEEVPGKPNPEMPEMMTARVMSVYKKVYDLVKKLMAFIEHLVLQLHSMINRKGQFFKPIFRSLDFGAVLDLLGRALRAIYIIDSIVENNGNIQAHWDAYKKLIKLARNEPEKFGSKSTQVKKLQKAMAKYEQTILSGSCMLTITEITFDEMFEKSNNPLGRIDKNKDLREFFEQYFERRLKSINEQLGGKFDMDEEKHLLELMCVYTLFRKLYPGEDFKDFWRELWGMQKKVPIIEARSFVSVYICLFMQSVCPLKSKPRGIEPKDERQFMAQYIVNMEGALSGEIVSQYTKFCVWLSRMESLATSNTSLQNIDRKESGRDTTQNRMTNRIYMLCEGFNSILRLNKLIYLSLTLHTNEEKQIPRKLLGMLLLAIETVKATAYIMRKKAEAFDTMVLSKTLTKDMLAILTTVYERVRQEKSKEHLHKVDLYHSVMALLNAPISELKITWLKHALGFLNDWLISPQDLKHLRHLLIRLEIVSYSRILTQRYENFSYLYNVRELLPTVFAFKRENPHTCKRLQFLFEGFEDASRLLYKCPHLADQEELFVDFKQTLVRAFEKNYMTPLKRNIEDFLRVSTTSMLIEKLEGVRPWAGELNDLMRMVQFEKVRIFDAVFDLRFEISESLNSSFYNLNILNMHDMETYELMRTLGNHIFDLRLHDVFLPNHTIERDKFDVLTVVRQIPLFVSEFKYNILNQRFLQVTGNDKIISCISIQQLSDSIRTHGLGILSTTVNAFYNFLKTKVTAFSKFLFLEDIQTILGRDRKWFKDYADKDDYPGFYPYERAQHLYNQIKKLGKFEEDMNYLDKFREILTAVGNSLGFIRLIRSASLHTESSSVEYLPNRPQIAETFEEIAGKSTMGEVSKGACKELDEILKSLEERFSDKIDYLNLMVRAFSKMVTKENKHLKLFCQVLPALSINYVEHVTRGKEQIHKKLASKAFIYDDGFVLGIAYFLTLLKQHDVFKTFHWEEAGRFYFEESKKESKAASVDTANHSAKFIEDLNIQKQLLIRKLQMMEEEFAFFNYNIVSAKILFKKKTDEPSPARQNAQ